MAFALPAAAVAGTAAAATAGTAAAATAVAGPGLAFFGSMGAASAAGAVVPALSVAAPAAGLFGTGITGFQALQGVASLGSSISSLFGGASQAAGLQQSADYADYAAKQERLRGLDDGNDILRSELEALGAAAARFGSAGIQLRGGEVSDQVSKGISEDAGRNFRRSESNARQGEYFNAFQGRQFRRKALSSQISGFAGAARGLMGLAA